MSGELEQLIQETRWCDTHNHQMTQEAHLAEKPDILFEVFNNYVSAELIVAAGSAGVRDILLDHDNPDIEKRFAAVADAWDAVQHTGYGEGARMIARTFFDIDEINGPALAAAQEKLPAQWPEDDRRKVIEDIGGCEWVQIDDHKAKYSRPDSADPEFFFYDLSWREWCNCDWDPAALHERTGVEIRDLDTLRETMAQLFSEYAPCALGVKTQHAYSRTLAWRERTDAEAASALEQYLGNPEECPEEKKLCLGDWCWARGVELSMEHNLPFKMHTGYYAGFDSMVTDRINSGNLCPLLIEYPDARFVLMHSSYPYQRELVALAKHFRNVWAEMSWTWAMNPHTSMDFVRAFIHAAPINKLLAFGGDCGQPRASAAYAAQARKWLGRALRAEIDDGYLTEKQAMDIARRVMHDNQEACFDVEGTRKNIRDYLDGQRGVSERI